MMIALLPSHRRQRAVGLSIQSEAMEARYLFALLTGNKKGSKEFVVLSLYDPGE